MHYNCNFGPYYHSQAGTGLAIYKGLPHQRGHGLFSNVFRRFGIPLLKYIGKTSLPVVKQLGEDIFLNRQDPKEAIKKNLKAVGKRVAQDVLDKAQERVFQMGSGAYKRRRRTRRKRRAVVGKKRKRVTNPFGSRKRKTSIKRRRKGTRVSISRVKSSDIFGY